MKGRCIRLISVLKPSRKPLVKGILIPDRLCCQLLNVCKDKIIKSPGLDLMARADLAAHAVVSLADIIGLIDGFPLFLGGTVYICSSDLLIARLHGLAAVRTV